MSTEEGALVGPEGSTNAPAEHSGICSISGACAVYWQASSSRHLVSSRGPNIITLRIRFGHGPEFDIYVIEAL